MISVNRFSAGLFLPVLMMSVSAAAAPLDDMEISQPVIVLVTPVAIDLDANDPDVAIRETPSDNQDMISDDILADLRGGETFVVGNQTLTAITSGNVLNGDYFAGDVSLADNALSNFTGIGNLIINTGAQVSLQAGMNLIINTGP